MEAKWTKTGVTIKITNTVNGMLEQGGVIGRVEHYSTQAISDSLSYNRGDDLNACADGEMATRAEMIRHHLPPRVLRRGTIIQ